MNTIAEKWESFQSEIIPKNAEKIQLREMKLAFYAGAFSMMEMQKEVIGNPSLSEDAGIALLQSWLDEMQLYFKQRP
jgi:hypothetical protein